jgi:hypothetical protein
MTTFQIVMIMAGVTTVVWLAHGLFPFLAGRTGRSVLAVALIFGLVSVANSPSTIIAVMTELRARGPLSDTVLSVSVVKDVIILLMTAVVIPVGVVLVDPERGFDFQQLRDFSLAIIVSLALGAAVGGSIGLYLARVNRGPILFVLAAAFGIVELTQTLGFEPEFYIIMSMSAGFVVQNFSVQGPRLLEALEANSLPLYALFFAVAGADLDLGVIPVVWQAGLIIIVFRALLIHSSTRLAALSAGDPPVIHQYAWMGFLAQAGVTLGLAGIVRERFPGWGEPVAAIIIAMVALNQLVGPPAFRFALVRAGEPR